MSKSSDLALHLAEERRWMECLTEEAERAYIIKYTKGLLPHQINQQKPAERHNTTNNGNHRSTQAQGL